MCYNIYRCGRNATSKQKAKQQFNKNPLVLTRFFVKLVCCERVKTKTQLNIFYMSQYTQQNFLAQEPVMHWGNVAAVFFVAAFLVGVSWLKDPNIFVFHNLSSSALALSQQDVPHYYAYVESADLQQPLVAGASTEDQGPSVINEDGTVTPIKDMGQVLGASISTVDLPLDAISVQQIPDSDEAIKNYFAESQKIESDYINNSEFEVALSSGDQSKIDAQAKNIASIKNNISKLSVPTSLVILQKLKISQYSAAENLLNNFTHADSNPEQVGIYLDQFLKAQQEMDSEMQKVSQNFSQDLPAYVTASVQE